GGVSSQADDFGCIDEAVPGRPLGIEDRALCEGCSVSCVAKGWLSAAGSVCNCGEMSSRLLLEPEADQNIARGHRAQLFATRSETDGIGVNAVARSEFP